MLRLVTICNKLKGTFNLLGRKDFKTIDNTSETGGDCCSDGVLYEPRILHTNVEKS